MSENGSESTEIGPVPATPAGADPEPAAPPFREPAIGSEGADPEVVSSRTKDAALDRPAAPVSRAAARAGHATGERRAASDAGRRPWLTAFWVSSTYFAEGLPYVVVRILSGAYFTDVGVKERYLGYLNFLGIPWNFKFLWAPLVDAIGTKKRWLVLMQLGISLLTMGIAVSCWTAPVGESAARALVAAAVLFTGMAVLSATNDIAIDAFYLDGIPDRGDQAAFSGYRVMAYRVSMIFARSGLVAIVAFAATRTEAANRHLPWAWGFGAGAATMFFLAGFHGWLLPRPPGAASPRPRLTLAEILGTYGRALSTYLQQERIALVLVFITVYKLGDEILFSMATPFLMRELAITKAQYSWVTGIVGAAATVGGAMIGGYWIKLRGLRRAILPLTIFMNFNIWAYVWLAWTKPDPRTAAGIAKIASVHGYEQFAAGLGSAVLLIYLLRTCKPGFTAAHYAIGSAIMSLGSTVVGGFGGRIVEAVGYLGLFLIAFLASIPSMVLLFWVPLRDEPPPGASAGSA